MEIIIITQVAVAAAAHRETPVGEQAE